jgi:N-methylhydantoinase B
MTATPPSTGPVLLRDLDEEQFRERYGCDRFTATVLASRFEYVIDHVSSKLMTNAFSPSFRDYMDFSTALTAGPALDFATPAVAKTLPVYIGTMRDGVFNCVREFGADRLGSGDVLICNDPYRAGTHVNDICFIRPIYADGQMVSTLMIRAHMIDVGGVVPGGLSGMKRDVYENGLVIPPTLLYAADRPELSAFALILDNSRHGELLLPDIQTIYQSLRFGEMLIGETIERYGLPAYEGAIRYRCDASAEAITEALRTLPDGVYTGYDDIDCDGLDPDHGYRVSVTIHKSGSRAEVDFSGTSRQAATSINCAWPDVKTIVLLAFNYLLAPSAPATSATLRDVDIVVPSGTITSAVPPDGPVHLYYEPMSSGFSAILRALNPVLGSRGIAGETRPYLHDAVGSIDGHGFVTTMSPSGGWGANDAGDADSSQLGYWTNYYDPPIESVEAGAPVFVLCKEHLVDSGGAGTYRGGAGLVKDSYWLTGVEHHICVPKVRTPNGRGVYGGGDGGLAGVWMWEDQVLDAKTLNWRTTPASFAGSQTITGLVDADTNAPDADGEYVHWGGRAAWRAEAAVITRFISCGGGGWGRPFDRDPEAVLRDVRDGYVSTAGAARDYGVAVVGDPETDPENLSIDAERTAIMRARSRPETSEDGGFAIAPQLYVEREAIGGSCPACGSTELASYPVLAESGWEKVVKCQACLTSVSREPWTRLGYLSLLEDTIEG